MFYGYKCSRPVRQETNGVEIKGISHEGLNTEGSFHENDCSVSTTSEGIKSQTKPNVPE